MKKKLVIGSRASRLARIQTQLVARRLKETFPELELEIRTMETTGDLSLIHISGCRGKGARKAKSGTLL